MKLGEIPPSGLGDVILRKWLTDNGQTDILTLQMYTALLNPILTLTSLNKVVKVE